VSAARVAFVMAGVGVVPRGAEVFVVDLARALEARGDFAVDVLSRGPAPPPLRTLPISALPRETRWVNALYRATRLGRKVLDTLFLDPLNLEWDTAALSAAPPLWRGDYDVVVMEGGLVGAWLCRMLRRAHGVRWIDIAHGNSPKWEGAFARQRPDRVVVFTTAAARMIQERAPRAALEVIPHGVDLERFTPGGDAADLRGLGLARPVVLAAGSVDAHKRLGLTVAAMARLGRGSLVVLGDGEEAAALDRLAAEQLGPGRYLRRRVPRDAMAPWYRACDLFTLPSRTESFGLVYLEALACGRAAVATDDAVRREVLGDAGICCAVEDPAAYAAALDDALARDWTDAPRRQAERFPFSRTVDRYAALLGALAATARNARSGARP
jgi:glycosyltransferase involved in cell wall biosynthesis